MLTWLPGYGALKVRYNHAAATLGAAIVIFANFIICDITSGFAKPDNLFQAVAPSFT